MRDLSEASVYQGADEVMFVVCDSNCRVTANRDLSRIAEISGFMLEFYFAVLGVIMTNYSRPFRRVPVRITEGCSVLHFITAARPAYAGTEGCSVLHFVVSFFLFNESP